MDWPLLLTPWTVGGGLFGLFLGIAAIIGVVANRRQVANMLARAIQHVFSPVGFFGLVILVFLGISTLESGQFFDSNLTHHAVFGLLGYALALGFDLVSMVCMFARLNATRMRDARGARLNLVGVCICAAVSAFANLAGSLENYQPADLAHTPGWVQVSAPWTSMVFPLLVVILSMTTDHILDHAPARDIDVQAYRLREKKRVELLQVRLDTERELLRLEGELTTLRNEREQASDRGRREWIWLRWLRPTVAPAQERALSTVLEQAMQGVQATLLEEVDTRLTNWTTEVNAHLHTLRTQPGDLQVQERPRYTTMRPHPAHPSQAPRAQRARTHDEPQGKHAQRDQVGARILAAFQQVGIGATDTAVAEVAGYSRTTVARWKKQLVAQGHFPATPEHLHATNHLSERPPLVSSEAQ